VLSPGDGSRAHRNLLGPAEAALLRAAFDAHDIHVVINAEHHASVLGGLGGAFVPLHIMVDEADAEEAAALPRTTPPAPTHPTAPTPMPTPPTTPAAPPTSASASIAAAAPASSSCSACA
jgi:hypothetical protein